LIVGIGSIYLDTHWVTDILSGWLSGIAILMVTIALDRHYTVSRAKHRAPSLVSVIPAPRRERVPTAAGRR
jgi:membrane-associated phospholipid phosphatase